MSMVSWFHRFRCVKGFIVSCVSWFHRFRGVNCLQKKETAFVFEECF